MALLSKGGGGGPSAGSEVTFRQIKI